MNPYPSLRQAVRPAILAYRLLALELERSAEIAAECEELLALSRELLTAAGQARLLGPGSEAGPEAGPRDAYADAALGWAKVAGSLTVLGGMLIDRGEWDQARRVAAALAAAGEDGAACDLRAQLGKAIWAGYHERLVHVRSRMAPAEIAASLATLRAVLSEVPDEFQDRNREVNRLLVPVACAIREFMAAHGAEPGLDSRVEHIAAGGVAGYPDIVAMSLAELCADFDSVPRERVPRPGGRA